MKRFSLLYILLLIPFYSLMGQDFEYGNGWYKSDPSRQFIKLVVEEEGIFRASAQDLQNFQAQTQDRILLPQ